MEGNIIIINKIRVHQKSQKMCVLAQSGNSFSEVLFAYG